MTKEKFKGLLIGVSGLVLLAGALTATITTVQTASDGDVITAQAWNALVSDIKSGGAGGSGGGTTCSTEGQNGCSLSVANMSWNCNSGYDWDSSTKTCTEAEGDPYWDNVILMLPLDSNTNDVSSNNTSVSNVGSLAIETSPSPFPGVSKSLKFVGETVAGDQYLGVSGDSAFVMGSSSFTIEGWYYFSPTVDTNGRNYLYSFINIDGAMAIDNNSSLGIYAFVNGGTPNSFKDISTIPSTNNWHHIATVYDSVAKEYRYYVDGVQTVDSISQSSNKTSFTSLNIGNWPTGQGRDFEGYLSNFRVTKGVARYSGTSFTVPTGPFPTN